MYNRRSPGALLAFVGLLVSLVGISADARLAGEQPLAKDKPAVDATTLRRKVLCGYQGWFRCPGDPAQEGWRHWSRDPRRIGPDTLTFEMWPDLTEYDDDEKSPASRTRTASPLTFSAPPIPKPSTATFAGCNSMGSTARFSNISPSICRADRCTTSRPRK